MSLACTGTVLTEKELFPDSGGISMEKGGPPILAPVLTVTAVESFPGVAIAEAGTCACSSVDEMWLVHKVTPSNWIILLETKLVPVTVSVKAGPPAIAEVGLIAVMVGHTAGVANGRVLIWHAGTDEEDDEPQPARTPLAKKMRRIVPHDLESIGAPALIYL